MLELSQKSLKIEKKELFQSFRHFCDKRNDRSDEWTQIAVKLNACERLLSQMSSERHSQDRRGSREDVADAVHDVHDLQRREIRKIIEKIEPKNYLRNNRTTKRRSIHRLKQLTEKLMNSQLKRSQSLQSFTCWPSATPSLTTSTTATLPRVLKRDSTSTRRQIDYSFHRRFKENDPNVGQTSPERQTQRQSSQSMENRYSVADVQNLMLSSPTSQTSLPSQSFSTKKNLQILKYSKKRLRGPYGEMLESMMNKELTTGQLTSSENNTDANNGGDAAVKQNLSFIQELLKETENQRKKLDLESKETTGTGSPSVVSTEVTGGEDQTTTATHENSGDGEAKTSFSALISRDLNLDTRTHIVGELYDTEKSFCEQLKELNEKYSKPLIEFSIIDSIFVEIIFGKIPEILSIHSKFLEQLRHRMTSWTPTQTTIGDLFDVFSDKSCHETYLSFVNNWFESKQLLRQLTREKPLFVRFLEQKSREHKSKLSLNELMISIIQRIPRFELLLKQLLKNTRKEHKDYDLLTSALSKIHSLVLYINRVNDADVNASADDNQSFITLKDLMDVCDEQSLKIFTKLTSNSSQILFISFVFIRKRERLLILLNDLLIIFSIKGRKKSEKFEENKYKVLNSFNLEFLEIISKSVFDSKTFEFRLKEFEKDLKVLTEMESMSNELSTNSRSNVEVIIQESIQSLNKQILDLKNCDKNLELISTQITSRGESRESQRESRDADVIHSTLHSMASTSPSWSTSASMASSLSSAAPTSSSSTSSSRDSILISFLSQEKRQTFERIFLELKEKKKMTKNLPEFLCALPIRKTRAGLQFTCATNATTMEDRNDAQTTVWIAQTDGYVGQINVLSINHSLSSSTIEPTVISCNGVCNSRITCLTSVPAREHVSTDSLVHQTSQSSDNDSDADNDSDRNDKRPLTLTSDPLTTGQRLRRERDSFGKTVWFGTEDSSVHIYSSFDAIRIKKNKTKVQLSSKVDAIIYFCERVFVGLSNRTTAIFDRDLNTKQWSTIPIIRDDVSCYRFCAVNNARELWTTIGNRITIRDKNLEKINDKNSEFTIDDMNADPQQCNSDYIREIIELTCKNGSQLVSISSQNSLNIYLFSAKTPFNHVTTVSIATALNRALISCEDIIRQHKSACLKISALLGVNDKLWIGTSAGVICLLDSNLFDIEIVNVGHTGHVRFLTAIHWSKALKDEKTLVISGGDGLELFGGQQCSAASLLDPQHSSPMVSNSFQFCSNLSQSESGREDSTNHLILWRI